MIKFLTISALTAVALLTHRDAASQTSNASEQYYVNFQDAAIATFKDVLGSLNHDQASKIKKLGVVLTAAPPGDSESYCISPWSMGLRAEYKGKPLIVTCPHTMSAFADYIVAGSIVTTSRIGSKNPTLIMKFLDGNADFIAATTEKLSRTYVAHLVAQHTNATNGEATYRCHPGYAAYTVIHLQSERYCEHATGEIHRQWLEAVGMTDDEILSLWRTVIKQLTIALIAHEIGHILRDNDTSQTQGNLLEEEIYADAFAANYFRTSPELIGAEMVWMNAQILWAHLKQVSASTKYPLPVHESMRLDAVMRMMVCKRDQMRYRYSTGYELLASNFRHSLRKHTPVKCSN
ncbi:hypothetical protein [Massilia sp. METH4]|uniref:ImmA/IrrE family metallo-endopeptidase n=1 Tax=Massilia sp. METH4 TaxID=3123041 RepID=UPI0030CD4727